MRGVGFYGHDFFVIKEDEELVSESITRLFNTNQNERLKYPYMGVDIRNMLFELADGDSEGFLREKILEQIETYEPRVKIRELNVEKIPDENTFNIHIGFSLVTSPNDERFLNFEIQLED